MTRTSGAPAGSGVAAIKRTFRRNRIAAVLLISFLAAMLYGSVLIAQSDAGLKEQLQFLTQEYFTTRGEQPILSTFLSSLSTSALYLVSAFFLGFFAFGQPVCVFIVLFRGFGLGISMGQIYLNYQMNGFLYCLVLIAPVAVLFTLVLVSALKDSIQMSNLFLALFFPKLGTATVEALKTYGIRYLAYAILAVVIAALDAGMNFLFSGILPL